MEIEPIKTFGEVFQEYLMSHKKADIKESMLETKFNIFHKYIFPTFEEMPVDTITDDDIANWQNKICDATEWQTLFGVIFKNHSKSV